MKEEQFTFYWLDGRKDVLYGITAHGALNNAGYGAGSVRALDFFVRGSDDNYSFVNGKWTKK